MAEVQIEAMTADHGEAVLAIYQAGLDTRNASFETQAPDWSTWDRAHLPGHRFVAVAPEATRGAETVLGSVLGWVACRPTSARPVYAGVVEESIYIAPAARGQGVGRALLTRLIASTESAGIWTVQSGIFPENRTSLALHKSAGFRVIGTRERIGEHFGRWRDVVLVERRSPVVSPPSP